MCLPSTAAVQALRIARQPALPLFPHLRALNLAVLACIAATAQAQQTAAQQAQPPALQVAQVESIVIKGQALTAERAQPYSVKRFDQQTVRDRQVTQLQQLFREVPGMEVRGLGYDGVADSIVLRGFGGGGHGGDIGYVIDGIPLNEASSHADGYADISVIVPLEIEGMDVFRGPVSALYGNYNRAGVIALRSRKGGAYREVDARAGSHGVVDVQAASGGLLGPAAFNGAAQVWRSSGYRPQTDGERATLSGRLGLELGRGTQASVAGRLHRAASTTASVITQDQYQDRSRFFDKHPSVQNDGTDKDFATLRADLAHSLDTDLRLLAFVYGTSQNFSRYFTRLTNATTWQQRSEDYKRDVRGYGVNLNGDQRVAGAALRWVAGVERYEEETRFRYLDALNQRQATAATYAPGGNGSLDRLLTTRTTSVFGQADWDLSPRLRPSLGLRHDRIGGGCERKGTETRTGASAQCNAMQDFSITTPKLGLRSTWVDRLLEARASVAEGFALPGDAAKFTAGLNVNPTRFRQTELGWSLRPAAGLSADLAVFRTDSRDEIVLADPANLVYANVGKTRRQGVELEARWRVARWLDTGLTLTRNRSRVLESRPETPFLVGQQVTGVPKSLVTFRATVKPVETLSLDATWRSVGRYAITQRTATADQRSYEGYNTLDLMLSWSPAPGGGGLSPAFQRYYLQVANVADKRYATSAGVTGGTPTYNPGPPRSVMLGASLDF